MPSDRRKGIDYAKAREALAGDVKDFPIPDWVYIKTPEKKKKRRRRRA